MRRLWFALPLVLLGCSGEEGTRTAWKAPEKVEAKYLPGAKGEFIQPDGPNPDEVVYSFTFWGCNRLDEKDAEKTGFASTANQAWLSQHLTDLGEIPTLDKSLPGPPPHLFFTGDLVLNEKDDRAAKLEEQMKAWSGYFASLPRVEEGAILPFLIPGNHEMLYKQQDGPDAGKEYLPKTDVNVKEFRRRLRDGGWINPTDNGNLIPSTASEKDQVESADERDLSYSFDVGDLHFVLLNTDTFTSHQDGDQRSIGWVQLNWLEKDLKRAEATADLIFIFGHKPAQAYREDKSAQPGDVAIHPALAGRFVQILKKSPKVAGYFVSHAHAWEAVRLGEDGPYQVIAGNAGSPFDQWPDSALGKPYFGPTVVKVTRGGTVTATSYGRVVDGDITKEPVGPLQKATEVVLRTPPSAKK